MNKEGLVRAIQQKMPHLTKKTIKDELETTLLILKEEISSGSTININKLGSISPKIIQARMVNNPNDNSKMLTPKKASVTFSPYSNLKNNINKAS